MRIEDVNIYDVVINISRQINSSTVEVVFKQGKIEIKASMRSLQSLEDERKTEHKILKYLGFKGEQIKAFDYD